MKQNNELAQREIKHKKTNKKGAQGWFTTLGRNPEVSKDFFNRATTFNDSSASTNGESGGGEASAMGESLQIESLSPINYKGYGIDYDIYGNNEYSVQYLGDDVIFETEEEAKQFIDSLFEPDDDISENFLQFKL